MEKHPKTYTEFLDGDEPRQTFYQDRSSEPLPKLPPLPPLFTEDKGREEEAQSETEVKREERSAQAIIDARSWIFISIISIASTMLFLFSLFKALSIWSFLGLTVLESFGLLGYLFTTVFPSSLTGLKTRIKEWSENRSEGGF